MPEYKQPTTVTDENNRELTARRTPQGWVLADGEGNDLITIGFNKDGTVGIVITDNTVSTTITASKFVQSDGTHDRLLMGDGG